MENCTEQTDKTTDCTTKPSTLSTWKVSQIILTVVNLLSEEGYFREGFDYMEMIRKKGIVLKEYSAFKSENLLELQKVSIGLWNTGLCLIFPDPQTGATCRMIAYNDNKSVAEVMQIIFHELAHIMLRHTQQSNLGEYGSDLIFRRCNAFDGFGTAVPHRANDCRKGRQDNAQRHSGRPYAKVQCTGGTMKKWV